MAGVVPRPVRAGGRARVAILRAAARPDMAGFDVDAIDDVIHGRLRLGIMAYLAHAEAADFNTLKAALKATQGNLSVHLRKLEEAGYVAIDKSFLNRKPLTQARPDFRRPHGFAAYLDAIAKLVERRG